jgi:hypothetical protein
MERAADRVERIVVFSLSGAGEVQRERVAAKPFGGKGREEHVVSPW